MSANKRYNPRTFSFRYHPMKLLIRNLSRSTTETDLKELFEAYGTVQSCNLVIDKKTGASKGFGFVEMPRPGEAKAAMKNLNGTSLDGNNIRVKRSESKATPDDSVGTDSAK